MPEQISTGPQFNALTGTELIEYIAVQVREGVEKALVNSGEFSSALTFPWVKYEFSVKVLAYPQQDVKEEPKINIQGTGNIINPNSGVSQTSIEPPIPVKETPIIIDLGESEVLDTPDKSRISVGLPTTSPAPGPGGVIIDKPIPPQIKKGK